MSAAFEIAYVCFFAGVVGVCGLALLSAVGWVPVWAVWVPRAVAGAGVVVLALRTLQAGHLPIFGTFENTLMASACLAVAAVATSWRRAGASSWWWSYPWALALLLYGTRFASGATPLTISEQSLWVDAHVVFAWLAFVSLLLASSLALARVLGRSFWGLSADEADECVARVLDLGFLALTATILVGAWYLFLLFSTFWRWEIVGTMSLAAWLGYGMVVHARRFYGLGGRRLAAAVLAVLPALVLAFWVWSLFPSTYHYFDVPLLKPY